jgi:ubiquinone/menaquinone biosynthesis C-methylase UbiE
MNPESAVLERYSAGAKAREESLCCPVTYDPRFLEAIPREVLERDYGCGDPSRHVREGEVVLDLGSGTGKIAFIAAQVVGPTGRVIGVDFNDDMLAVARAAQPAVARTIGFANVEFLKGRIQDLKLGLEALADWLEAHPVRDLDGFGGLQAEIARLREEAPLVATESVDVVVSNCVLNLVPSTDKPALFQELHRVLRRGGRAVISDIVSDREVPGHLQRDADLWSGCISGAMEETAFLRAFEAAGFHGITLEKRDAEPWRTVEGITFRSVTVVAYKGKQGPCWDFGQAVIYRGPWKRVEDDDGHVLLRGVPQAVCGKTFELLGRAPYTGMFERLEPPARVLEPRPFPCGAAPAAISVGHLVNVDHADTGCCGGGAC